jgi:hypothetical protein
MLPSILVQNSIVAHEMHRIAKGLLADLGGPPRKAYKFDTDIPTLISSMHAYMSAHQHMRMRDQHS